MDETGQPTSNNNEHADEEERQGAGSGDRPGETAPPPEEPVHEAPEEITSAPAPGVPVSREELRRLKEAAERPMSEPEEESNAEPGSSE